MIQPYKRRWHLEYWSQDRKPKGDWKHHIEASIRAEVKDEIRLALTELERDFHSEADEWYREELDRAWLCHEYGICATCNPEGNSDDE